MVRKIRREYVDKAIRILLVLILITVLALVGAVWRYFAAPPVEEKSEEPVVQVSNEEAFTEAAIYQQFDETLFRADGSQVTLSELRGRPVLLVFWSSWCPDCKDFLQNGVTDTFAAVREQGGEAFLVCREGKRGETWDTAQQALRDMNVAEPTLMDQQSVLYGKMGLSWVPSAALLDEKGRLMVVTTSMPNRAEITEMLRLLDEGHQAYTEGFLRRSLLQKNGAVPSEYGVQDGRIVYGQDVLSETQGLMMLYAAKAGDQQLFDLLLDYVGNEMSVSGLAAWVVSDGVAGQVNASLDDLRILEALYLAEEKWGGYRQELSYRESALYRRTVDNGYMRDYVALRGNELARKVTLCYLDVAAMEKLGKSFGKWKSVAENSRAILSGGVISEAFPLYYPSYNPDTGRYGGDYLQMNEALVTLYNAARAGLDCHAALDWLEQQMQTGGIFARYDVNGRPMRGYLYESTATYALLVQTALLTGRNDLAQKALSRMERTRNFSASMAGDMGYLSDEKHYTFDLVQTLLAWQQWNDHMK